MPPRWHPRKEIVIALRERPRGDSQAHDGIDEMWYVLERYSEQGHLSHETNTIKYYFDETPPNMGNQILFGDEFEEVLEEIKNVKPREQKLSLQC